MAHSPKISRSYRITDEVDRQVKELAQRFKKSEGEVVGLAVAGLFGTSAEGGFRAEVNRWFQETWTRLDEILETVQTVPELEPAERLTGAPAFDPASIPGIERGAQALRPPRETSAQIVLREQREKMERTAALDRSAEACERTDIDRSDEYVGY